MNIRLSLRAQFKLQVGIETRLAIVTMARQATPVLKNFVERQFYSLGLCSLQILGKR